jgi:hypothetical protein
MIKQIVRRTPPDGVTLPFLSNLRLRGLRSWIEYKLTRGQVPAAASYAPPVIVDWTKRVTELETMVKVEAEGDCKPVKLVSLLEFESWEHLFLAWVARKRSPETGVPFTYLLRAHTAVTAAQLADAYSTIDDDLVATTELTGARFTRDNKRLWDEMVALFQDGPLWAHMHPFRTTKNARAAYLAGKLQAEGLSVTQSRASAWHKEVAELAYTGKGKFTFDQFISRLKKAYTSLEQLGEPTAETKKVRDLLLAIKDPALEHTVWSIRGRPQEFLTFESAQLNLTTVVSALKAAPSQDDRRVAKVDTKRPRAASTGRSTGHPQAAKKVKGIGNGPDGKILLTSGHYSKEDWTRVVKEHGEDGMTKVKALRASSKKNKRKASAICTLPMEVVAGLKPSPVEAAKSASVAAAAAIPEDVPAVAATDATVTTLAAPAMDLTTAAHQFGHVRFATWIRSVSTAPQAQPEVVVPPVPEDLQTNFIQFPPALVPVEAPKSKRQRKRDRELQRELDANDSDDYCECDDDDEDDPTPMMLSASDQAKEVARKAAGGHT